MRPTSNCPWLSGCPVGYLPVGDSPADSHKAIIPFPQSFDSSEDVASSFLDVSDTTGKTGGESPRTIYCQWHEIGEYREIHGSQNLHEHQIQKNKSEDDILSGFLKYASSENSSIIKHIHFDKFEQRTSPNAIITQQLGQQMEAPLNHDLETVPPMPTCNAGLDTSSNWGSQNPRYIWGITKRLYLIQSLSQGSEVNHNEQQSGCKQLGRWYQWW